jgi:tetraacyldisaccharide 4'-kinase
MRGAGEDAGVPVICIGNFVAGGAGKTPTTLAIAALLRAAGETPFVLSRGYGGSLPGPVEVDPARHRAAEVGDEPLLIAGRTRTVISRDRPAGARLARARGASVIVMDDGLQNPSLRKDLRIAVVDGAGGVGNGLCLPAGPLRAPLAAQIQSVDAVLLIGAGEAGEAVARAAEQRRVALLRGRLEIAAEVADRLAGARVLAVSGIGRPEKFAETLRAAGAEIVAERRFGDHHRYSPAEVGRLFEDARRRGAVVATTEKDMTKLAALMTDAQRDAALAVPVSLSFEEPGALSALLAAVR